MRKSAYLLLFFLVCGAVKLIASPGPSRQPVVAVMQFQPAHADNWKDDSEVQIEDVDHDHLVFASNPSIDMNLLRQDDDLSLELAKKGRDEVVQQILHGQNLANTIFSVGETKLIDSHLDTTQPISVLTLHTKQDLPDGTYERIEKYFVGPGQTLHAELRWKTDAATASVKQARADFENGKFSLAGVK